MEQWAIGRDGQFHPINELTPEEVKAWKDGLSAADRIYKKERELRSLGIPLTIKENLLEYERRNRLT